MPTGRFLSSRLGRAAPDSGGGAAGSGKTSQRGRVYLVALVVAFVIVVGVFVSGLGTLSQPSSTTSSTTASTSYSIGASSVIASAASSAPSFGYAQGSSKQLNPKESGLESAGYALFSDQGGAAANMTIIVFNSTTSAQRYVDSVISNAKDLSGYTNANSTLTSFEHYGTCYGYAETDPDGGGAIATGVCTKGNVYIMVHVASVASIVSTESDMSNLVGAAYQGIG
jgi:hypothetical protein